MPVLTVEETPIRGRYSEHAKFAALLSSNGRASQLYALKVDVTFPSRLCADRGPKCQFTALRLGRKGGLYGKCPYHEDDLVPC